MTSPKKAIYFAFTKCCKMMKKYHRKFQTDDENLEFATGTFRPQSINGITGRLT